MSGKLIVVVGGNYGSEGKGATAAYLSGLETNLHAVRVAGSNAGHSVYSLDGGTKFKLQHVPVAAITNPNAKLYLAAGSEIKRELLKKEIDMLDAAGYNVSRRIYVDKQATVLSEDHGIRETGLVIAIGSTGEGVGACRSDRIMRTAELYGGTIDTGEMLREALENHQTVLIEGTQGYALGLHAGWYPKCTSSDTRAIDFMAMAGISPWAHYVNRAMMDIWVVCRTFPIRVAGDSGPLYRETTWEAVGVEPEFTTVTKKMRRVGQWDWRLCVQALRANGAIHGSRDNVRVALNFFDYIAPKLKYSINHAEFIKSGYYEWLCNIEEKLGHTIDLLGTGPNTCIDLRRIGHSPIVSPPRIVQ